MNDQKIDSEGILPKHHSKEADDLDLLCRKLSDVRVKNIYSEAESTEELRLCDISTEMYQQILQSLKSPNEEIQHRTLIHIRKLLSTPTLSPQLPRLTETLLPSILPFLDKPPALQFETLWILTNIAAGSSQQTAQVCYSGSLDKMIQLIKTSPYKEIKEQSIWCLGNIAGDGPELRKYLLGYHILEQLVQTIESEMQLFTEQKVNGEAPLSIGQIGNHFSLSLLRIAIWAMSNFCRGSSELDWDMIATALPLLEKVLKHVSPNGPHTDEEILMDACWALSRVLRGIHEGMQTILAGVELCRELGVLISHPRQEVQIPALRCLINIVSGSDLQTDVVIEANLLPILHSLIMTMANDHSRNPSRETILKEACLIVSNITAGSTKQVHAVIQSGFVESLLLVMKKEGWRVKRECVWVFVNMLLSKEKPIVDFLCQNGVLQALSDLLITPKELSSTALNKEEILNGEKEWMHCIDERMVLKILEGFKLILQTGDSFMEEEMKREADLLSGFEKINISASGYDSAYSSTVDLYQTKQNPYLFYFTSSITGNELNGRDRIELWYKFWKKQTSIAKEIHLLSEEILYKWFA